MHAVHFCKSSSTDNEIRNLEAQINVKDKQDRLGAVSEESSSGDGQVIGKRMRRQPGQWWMSCSERPEETEVTASQPTQKRQSKKEPKAATASPVKGKKDRILKRGDQQPAPSSVQNTKHPKLKKGNKEKRNNQNKNVNRKGEAPVQMTVFDEVEAEEDKQQEIQDPLLSSPLALTNRDLILNSGKEAFSNPAFTNTHSAGYDICMYRLLILMNQQNFTVVAALR